MLAHVFGASSVAISTVVTVFMAGLGLGAFFAGKYADRIKHPVITYAVVELLVGLWALLVPVLLASDGWLAGMNATLRNELGAGSMGFMLARFACVVPILIVPTTLMGSSLPLLSRHFVNRQNEAQDVGSWVGALYAVNTFGAVAGVILAGFILMPTVGVSATNFVAVGMNIVLAVAIFALRGVLLGPDWKKGDKLSFLPGKEDESKAKEVAGDDGEADEVNAPSDPDDEGDTDEEDTKSKSKKKKSKSSKSKKKKTPKKKSADEDEEASWASEGDALPELGMPIPAVARKAAFVAFAASGAAALCYEVVWSRALAMTIGSSVYSFSLILVTFLIGIAGGSAFASSVVGNKRVLESVGIFSVVLTLLANGIWGVERGVVMWLVLSLVFCLPIAVVWAAVRARRKSFGSHHTNLTIPVLVLAAVPASAAIVNAIIHAGHLSTIVATVTVTLSVFLAAVVVLRRYPVFQLAAVQLFIAAATFANYVFQDEIPCAFAAFVSSVSELHESIGLVQFFMFVTASLCTLPATMGMGAMFPMTLRIFTSGGESVGRDVGTVYAGNTIGSIIGAWLPGFVLMQFLGMERTLLVGMFLNLGLALMMLVASSAEVKDEDDKEIEPPAWHSVAIYILAPLVPALCAGLYLGGWRLDGPLRWNSSQMTLGVFRVSLAEDACSDDWGEPDLVYYRDGLSTTVTVERWGRHYALKNNGKVDASNGDDMPTQIMVGAYPLLMHPRGATDLDVAVVGFGSGVTVGTTLKFPVRSVDVIELEKAVLDASRFFEEVNHLTYALDEFPFVEMDRLSVINDDGRNYLASTDKQYDVIISEPSNPWITGVSDLFTTDHFRITKQRLREGGIYCQWVQLYELSPENIKTIYRTFASQFEHVVVFSAEDLSSDTVLLGSDSPLPLDIQRIARGYELPGISRELERAYIHTPYDAFARTLLSTKEEVLSYTRIERRRRGGEWIEYPDSNNDPDTGCTNDCERIPAVLNTDDNAHIEFAAPRDLIGFQRYEGYLTNIYAQDWPYGRIMTAVEGFGEGTDASRAYAELSMSLIAHGRKPEAAAFVERSRSEGETRETVIAAEVLTRLISAEGEPALRTEPPVPGPQLAPREARQLMEGFAAVQSAVDLGSYGTALAATENIPSPLRMHSGPGLRMLYGYLLFKTAASYPSRYRESIDQLEDLVRGDEEYARRHPEIYYFLGRAHDAEMNFDKALRNMRVFVEARMLAAEDDERARLEREAAAGAAEGVEGGDENAPTTDEPGEADKTEDEAPEDAGAPNEDATAPDATAPGAE